MAAESGCESESVGARMAEIKLCVCGCGQPVEVNAKGRPGKYASGTCRVRVFRYNQVTKINQDIQVKDNEPIKPILKYPGAKWSRAKWIISHFPEHKIYLEPFCGSAAVFFNKSKSDHEILGDADGNIINLLSVLRRRGPELAYQIDLTPWAEAEYEQCEKAHSGTGDELEDARRFLVRCWQAHGTQFGKKSNTWRHRGIKGSASTTELWQKVPDRLMIAARRLKDAEIRNRPALELIEYYNHPDCLIYADPPYVKSTRKSVEHYKFEMTNEQHIQMLEVLKRHQGSVILSGYESELYDEYLPGWQKVFMPTVAEHGNIHLEVLWLNAKAHRRQMSLFEEVL
jgi:DNA adenine methylase